MSSMRALVPGLKNGAALETQLFESNAPALTGANEDGSTKVF
jgi:hypothetical protein